MDTPTFLWPAFTAAPSITTTATEPSRDVTAKAGLDHFIDPEYGPLWAITAAWVDVNNDGLLDLFVANYLQWDYQKEPLCDVGGQIRLL